MAVPTLTEAELRSTLENLDALKKSELPVRKVDFVLNTGTVVSFTYDEKIWTLK